MSCNPLRQLGQQGCNAGDRCCLDGENVPGCNTALALQYCETCDVAVKCDDNANTCSSFQCSCGNLGVCNGATPYCINSAGNSQCTECTDNDHCAGHARGEFCAANNTCQNCIDADFDCGNQQVCVRGGALDGACGECSPAGPQADGCDPDGSVPFCRPGTATCVGCDQVQQGCLQNRNGSVCVSTPGHPFRGRCLSCDPDDPNDGNCDNAAAPICGNNGQCRACNPNALQEECSNGQVCQETGECEDP